MSSPGLASGVGDVQVIECLGLHHLLTTSGKHTRGFGNVIFRFRVVSDSIDDIDRFMTLIFLVKSQLSMSARFSFVSDTAHVKYRTCVGILEFHTNFTQVLRHTRISLEFQPGAQASRIFHEIEPRSLGDLELNANYSRATRKRKFQTILTRLLKLS